MKPSPVLNRAPFDPGRVVATPGALAVLGPLEVHNALSRHFAGDWGDCGPEDWQRNEEALVDGARLFSVYHDQDGTAFWIVTAADRSVTSVLLPSEY